MPVPIPETVGQQQNADATIAGLGNLDLGNVPGTASYSSIDDVVRLAYAAGFRGNDLITAVAVALARSQLNAAMVDTSGADATWGAKVGLWGIRSRNDQQNTGGSRDAVVNVDAWRNAQAAFDLYRRAGNSFSDWSAFTSGAYRQFVDDVKAAVAGQGGEARIASHVTQARTQGLYVPSLGQPVGWKPPPGGAAGTIGAGVVGAAAAAASAPRVVGAAAPAPAPPRPAATPGGTGGPGVLYTQTPNYQTGGADAYPGQGTPAEQEQWIRAHYGAIAYMLDDPEIGPILRQAAAEGWDDARFTARLQQTKWFQTHDAAARSNDALRHNDPAQWNQTIADEAAQLRQQAATKGVTISEARARELAQQGLSLGWGPGDWDKAIAGEFHYTAGTGFVGGTATTAQQMRQQAQSYGIQMTDGSIAWWIGQQLDGTRTMDDYTEQLRRQAAARYTYWADEINAGYTPMELANPYIQALSQTYGRNANDITLDDPDIRAALSHVDPKTGKRTEMGEFAFEQYLKRPGSQYWTDPANTTAINTAASVVSELGQRMGVVAQ